MPFAHALDWSSFAAFRWSVGELFTVFGKTSFWLVRYSEIKCRFTVFGKTSFWLVRYSEIMCRSVLWWAPNREVAIIDIH